MPPPRSRFGERGCSLANDHVMVMIRGGTQIRTPYESRVSGPHRASWMWSSQPPPNLPGTNPWQPRQVGPPSHLSFFSYPLLVGPQRSPAVSEGYAAGQNRCWLCLDLRGAPSHLRRTSNARVNRRKKRARAVGAEQLRFTSQELPKRFTSQLAACVSTFADARGSVRPDDESEDSVQQVHRQFPGLLVQFDVIRRRG